MAKAYSLLMSLCSLIHRCPEISLSMKSTSERRRRGSSSSAQLRDRAVATECCVHAAFLERIRIRGGTCCSRPKADVGSAWEVRMQSNGGHAHRAAICAAGKCPKGELPPLA